MADFLSESWFESLAAALTAVRPAAGGEPAAMGAGPQSTGHEGTGLAIGQIVRGVPAGAAASEDGEVRYTIVLRPQGPATLVRDSTTGADVTLVEDWTTAEAIACGRSSVAEMLSAGNIKLHGDTRALVAAGDFLAGIAPLVAENLSGRDPA